MEPVRGFGVSELEVLLVLSQHGIMRTLRTPSAPRPGSQTGFSIAPQLSFISRGIFQSFVTELFGIRLPMLGKLDDQLGNSCDDGGPCGQFGAASVPCLICTFG
jgi:hypothetical protein